MRAICPAYHILFYLTILIILGKKCKLWSYSCTTYTCTKWNKIWSQFEPGFSGHNGGDNICQDPLVEAGYRSFNSCTTETPLSGTQCISLARRYPLTLSSAYTNSTWSYTYTRPYVCRSWYLTKHRDSFSWKAITSTPLPPPLQVNRCFGGTCRLHFQGRISKT
jgi:hypothetical protein